MVAFILTFFTLYSLMHLYVFLKAKAAPSFGLKAGVPLVILMVLSAVLNGLLLPFVLVYAISLINNKKLMEEYTNSKIYNYISWGTVASVICLTISWVFVSIF